MKRRDFILGSAIALSPLAVRAQQSGAMRRVGVLIGGPDNAEFRPRVTLFMETMAQLGWIDGKNIRFDVRWNDSDPSRIVAQARELIRSKPDVLLAAPTRALIPLQKETRTIPIVFVSVSDPLGQGIVDSLARPSGNVTGFSNLEFSLLGKWLQLLKEIAPNVKRIGLMISTTNASSPRWFGTFATVAPTLGVEPVAAPVTGQADIERVVKSLSRQPTDALIVVGDSFVEIPATRRLIVELVAAQRLPTLYGLLSFAADGGMICYGIEQLDPYRRAASYVDRILKGGKISDLPVQQPTKFHFVLNLKTAKALGLEPSTTLVAAADEVIE
jgi:putative ABC transport system substrate-binding protein